MLVRGFRREFLSEKAQKVKLASKKVLHSGRWRFNISMEIRIVHGQESPGYSFYGNCRQRSF